MLGLGRVWSMKLGREWLDLEGGQPLYHGMTPSCSPGLQVLGSSLVEWTSEA